MSDGFKPAIPQESQEFENLEKSLAAPVGQSQPNTQESLDVKDQIGQAIETATQSIFGPTDPAQIQKQAQEEAIKKQDDQKKIGNIKTFLNQMAKDEQELRNLRQKEQQDKQEKEQEVSAGEQEEEMKKKKKEDSFIQEHIKAEQSKAERKGGVGG